MDTLQSCANGTTGNVAIVALILIVILAFGEIHSYNNKLRHIPAIGPANSFLSYIGVYKHFINSRQIIRGGYEKGHLSVYHY
ncbi:hypothetical protein BDQ17DRAFT_687160 [Cyathus striatus]|nr:hypothetical protein BDQ17DRAFT_687160 [Cyathus striatus]